MNNQEIDKTFSNKVLEIKNSNISISIEDKLKLYGLYKQALFGNINIEKPSFFNYEQKVKWESWNKCKNLSKVDAKTKYINLIKILYKKN